MTLNIAGKTAKNAAIAFAVGLSSNLGVLANESQTNARAATNINPPQALMLTGQAVTLKEGGHLQEAEVKLKSAQQIFVTAQSTSSYYVRCLYTLATVYAAQNKNAEAERCYRQILAIKAKVGWVDYLDSIYRELGLTLVKENKLTEVDYWFAKHIELHSKNVSLQAYDCDGIAWALNRIDQPKMALTYFARAKALRQNLRPVDEIADCQNLNGTASAKTELGQYAEAEKLFLEAKRIADVKNSPELSVSVLRGYSKLATLTNRPALAAELAKKAELMMQSYGQL